MANHTGPPPEWLNCSYLEPILQTAWDSPELKLANVSVTAGSNVGDNYACQIFRITLDLREKGKDLKKSIIAKFLPDTKLLESMEGIFDAYGTEARFFTDLLPILEKYIPKGTKNFFPKCLKTDDEKKTILMDDLVSEGFCLQKRGDFLGREQAVLVIDALATFHGASLHVVEEKPEITKVFHKAFWNAEENEPMIKMFANSQKALDRCCGKYDLPEKYKTVLLGMFERFQKERCKVLDFQEGKINVLLHGDSWKSNMMFHYQNDTPDAVVLLDFQLVNYNCFANDLLYFIFSSVSSDAIVQHLDEFIEQYYKKLKTIAPNMPDLTLERVRKEVFERLYFGFLMTVAFRAIMLSEKPPDMADILDGKHDDMGFGDERFASDLKVLLSIFERNGVFH